MTSGAMYAGVPAIAVAGGAIDIGGCSAGVSLAREGARSEATAVARRRRDAPVAISIGCDESARAAISVAAARDELTLAISVAVARNELTLAISVVAPEALAISV